MTIKYKCLYEITGRIEDVNTFLVPLQDLPREPEQEPVSSSGLERTFRLPEEQEFIDAMRRRTLKSTVGMTPAEIAERNALADAVLDEIFSQPEQEPVACVESYALKDLSDGRLSCHTFLWNVNRKPDSTSLVDLYTTPPQPKEPEQEPAALDVTLNEEASEFLRDTIGADEVSPIRLLVGNGHSGHGLYVANAEYQQEGASLLVNTTPPQRKPLLFPTMLRKMWSGGEVQDWLDENYNNIKASA